MSENEHLEGETPVELLLFPQESRPWTGYESERRFLPARVIVAPDWLSVEEAESVNRHYWNHFHHFLREQGYQATLKLSGRTERRLESSNANHVHSSEMADQAEQDWVLVHQASEKFGASARVDEADGRDGWEIRGVALFAPDEYNKEQKYNLSIRCGTTWSEAVANYDKEHEEWRFRRKSASNRWRSLAYLCDVLDSVIRHFETHGISWEWDDYSKHGGRGLVATDTTGADDLVHILTDESSRLKYIDEVLCPLHYHREIDGGWAGVAKAARKAWLGARLTEARMPEYFSDGDKMGRNIRKYRERQGEQRTRRGGANGPGGS